MPWEAWFTAILILLMLGTLATGRFGTDIVMFGVLTTLVVAGIVSPKDAFVGFSNTGLMTVAFLYIVATGLQETGAMTLLTARVLGRPRSALSAQTRLIFPVAGMSAFFNNTPLVAMFMPVLRELSRRTSIPVSRLFMPLSFAAILGGVCSLIGTSTNLVVFSLIEAHNASNPDRPLPRMGMWTISAVGIPVCLVGLAYILIFGRALLPVRARPGDDTAGAKRQYNTAMKVSPGSPLIDKTIEQAGLRHLPGLYLSRIDRARESIVAVSPGNVLKADDVLVFVGDLDSVVDLQRFKGLVPITDESALDHYRPHMKLIEAVVSPSSPLVGRTIRDSGIRTRYGAVVIAVHRLGHKLGGRIGDVVLRPGDTLLLEADSTFTARHRQSSAFYLVSELEGSAAPRHERAWIALVILAALILLMSFDSIPLIGSVPEVVAAMAAAGAMILLRCCTGPQARSGLEWNVLLTIGASFGIAKAMADTGLAATIANAVLSTTGSLGPTALIASTYLITLAFTALISNNAAAALMFPIALGIASSADPQLNFLPFAIAIALGASCEFTTPLGYQTNLMVMGPGGYRWPDYIRFGGPLTLLVAVVAIFLIPKFYPLVPDSSGTPAKPPTLTEPAPPTPAPPP